MGLVGEKRIFDISRLFFVCVKVVFVANVIHLIDLIYIQWSEYNGPARLDDEANGISHNTGNIEEKGRIQINMKHFE